MEIKIETFTKSNKIHQIKAKKYEKKEQTEKKRNLIIKN